MIILRLLLILTAIALVISLVLFIFTGNRRYLTYIRNVFWFSGSILLILGLLYIVERFVLTGWRILV